MKDAISRLALDLNATLFMILLAVLDVVLYYFTQKLDIVVGSDVSNRSRPETESLIGFFVNQIVLRTSLEGNPSFTALVGRVRDVCLDAYDHQDLPFHRLVEELNPERTSLRSPLFDLKVVLQNAPQETISVPGLTWTPLSIPLGAAKFDFMLTFREQSDDLIAIVEYDPELLDSQLIRAVRESFIVTVNQVVFQSDLSLRELVTKVDEHLGEQRRRAGSELKALFQDRIEALQSRKQASIELLPNLQGSNKP